MTRKSVQELINQAVLRFPDNISGLINPADVRETIIDFLKLMQPSYSLLILMGPNIQTIGVTPSTLVFDTSFDSDPSQSITNISQNTIARVERGISKLVFNINLAAGRNDVVTFILAVDGVVTNEKIKCTGRGFGKPIPVSFDSIRYHDSPCTYSVLMSTGKEGETIILENGSLSLTVVHVNDYS